MGISRQNAPIAETISLPVYSLPALYAESEIRVASPYPQDPGVMKLMAPHLPADREKGIFFVHFQNRVAMSLRFFFHPETNGQHAYHRVGPAFQGQAFSQIHQPAALGVDRQTSLHGLAQGSFESRIFGQSRSVGFREPAADVKPVNGR